MVELAASQLSQFQAIKKAKEVEDFAAIQPCCDMIDDELQDDKYGLLQTLAVALFGDATEYLHVKEVLNQAVTQWLEEGDEDKLGRAFCQDTDAANREKAREVLEFPHINRGRYALRALAIFHDLKFGGFEIDGNMNVCGFAVEEGDGEKDVFFGFRIDGRRRHFFPVTIADEDSSKSGMHTLFDKNEFLRVTQIQELLERHRIGFFGRLKSQLLEWSLAFVLAFSMQYLLNHLQTRDFIADFGKLSTTLYVSGIVVLNPDTSFSEQEKAFQAIRDILNEDYWTEVIVKFFWFNMVVALVSYFISGFPTLVDAAFGRKYVSSKTGQFASTRTVVFFLIETVTLSIASIFLPFLYIVQLPMPLRCCGSGETLLEKQFGIVLVDCEGYERDYRFLHIAQGEDEEGTTKSGRATKRNDLRRRNRSKTPTPRRR